MKPVSRLFLPSPAVAGCLFVGVFRDIRGANLAEADRINHFPASPVVAVTQVISGSLQLLPIGHQTPVAAEPLPPLFVKGPQDTPTSSLSGSDTAALTVGFYHDAWLAIGGSADYREVPDSIAAAISVFADHTNPARGWDAFCSALTPLWEATRPSPWGGTSSIADWTQAVMTRAALSNSGRSLRSLERRLKRASGQTRRTLVFFETFESLRHVVKDDPNAPLAEIAAEAGYADQSHMGRAVRRATSFSPARLNRAIETEEAFWCYRLLGEQL